MSRTLLDHASGDPAVPCHDSETGTPYVDVRSRISRAFAAFAVAGRIGIVGRLNGTDIRGSLIPVGRAGHRLFLHGGMRAAAMVDVGDQVSITLRPLRPGEVSVPRDVRTALRRHDANGAFAAQPVARQRQVVRYVDVPPPRPSGDGASNPSLNICREHRPLRETGATASDLSGRARDAETASSRGTCITRV